MPSLIDRGLGLVRGTAKQAGRAGAFAAGRGYGLIQQARSRTRGGGELDDTTLARKVETVLFRGPRAPKSKVNVNVVEGVVYLRGEVKQPADVKRLESEALAIPEVRGVENLLHLPKTPSPTRTDTPARQRRTGAAAKARQKAKPRTGHKKVTQEPASVGKGAAGKAEPKPVELATKREGRQPAPLGSEDPDAGEGSTGGGSAGGGTPGGSST